MPRVKQASKHTRTTKAAAATVLGTAGLGLSLGASASANTIPTADFPQSQNIPPNQRFVLGEEEMVDVSLASSVCTVAASPVTSTTSRAWPNCIFTSTRTIAPGSKVTPLSVKVLNPAPFGFWPF